MLVAERLQKIVELVNERKSIRVSELSEICSVTEETIRRDLDKLEAEGKLLRSHGGAVSIKETHSETPYPVREITNADEKRRIAQEAIKHIEPRERILLDASTTAWWIAKLLPDMPLTVLTNSMKVALELAGKKEIQVISTGGLMTQGSLSYVGPLAERSLGHYHVEKFFFSCQGIHPAGGISESNELQALVKQKMLSISDEAYLLADYSKFGVRAFAHVADFKSVGYLITDQRTDKTILSALQDQGIEVIQLKG